MGATGCAKATRTQNPCQRAHDNQHDNTGSFSSQPYGKELKKIFIGGTWTWDWRSCEFRLHQKVSRSAGVYRQVITTRRTSVEDSQYLCRTIWICPNLPEIICRTRQLRCQVYIWICAQVSTAATVDSPTCWTRTREPAPIVFCRARTDRAF